MRRKIILLTGYEHFFGQTRKPWVSINTAELITDLQKKGLDVTEIPFHKIINSDLDIHDSIIFYTFSQRDNLRHYIKDVIYSLQRKDNIIVPGYELLLCHENKGYQESLKKEYGITDLPAKYFSSKRELQDYSLEYPLVLKTIEGSNGRGVFLIRSKQQLDECFSKIESGLSIFTKLDLWRRKYLRHKHKFVGYDSFDNKKDYLQYKDYITPEMPFIIQKFIPGLEYDYRIIILGEHYYVTKRLTRKGDFRASGAKRFTFDFSASDELLDYAKNIYERFNSPCLSIDIGESHGNFYLFEYQAQHFGINAIVRGKGFYQHMPRGWEFTTQKIAFEKELSTAFIYYLTSKKLI